MGWVTSKELAAVAANVFQRREQMSAISAWLRAGRGFRNIGEIWRTLSAEKFVAATVAQGGGLRLLPRACEGIVLRPELAITSTAYSGSFSTMTGSAYRMLKRQGDSGDGLQ